MTFHPDSHLPDCMMPDGGECCVGHRAVCEDWHRQRDEIERLREALAAVVRDVNDYECQNNLAPNPGRTECWDSVARAKELLK